MGSFQGLMPQWDFSGSVDFTQMQDEEFMNMLSKQFPVTGAMGDPKPYGDYYQNDNFNNQAFAPPLPSLSPPSQDSSPSPPNSNQVQEEAAEVTAPPKRKAVDEPAQGPSAKISSSDKAAGPSTAPASSTAARRKSAGGPKDESRLLKRKEQNRAAQRAFRERKEKHVKDLEDQVAELTSKHNEAQHENENLRDLLTRLQSENVMLKQQFTFSMPRSGNTQAPSYLSGSDTSFNADGMGNKDVNPLDYSSLHTFDPARLNLLDDLSQPSASDGASPMNDFSFGNTGLASNAPYTAIASNPTFMSFASSFDPSPTGMSGDTPDLANMGSTATGFDFNMNSMSTWPPASNSNDHAANWNPNATLDELLQSYLNPPSNTSFFGSSSSVSPISHHSNPRTKPSHSASSGSTPSSTSSDPLFTPRETATPDSDSETPPNGSSCPRNKKELAKCIEDAGDSPFAPGVKKMNDNLLGTMISCSGTSFPRTQKSDQNVEVLTAWRNITQNPSFKDTDISELCSEFTAKARCDGHKVVIEPEGVVSIMETLQKKH